jgi:hypothetical protein
VGETLVLFFLIKGAWAILTGTPPEPGREPLQIGPAVMVGLFLLVWLALWTVGGIAAMGELLRLLWSEDRIVVAGGRLTVTWARGPFRKVRTFERDAIRGIALVGQREHLTLETHGRRLELSGLGTREERVAGAAALRAELALTEDPPAARGLPAEWEEIVTPEGERALVARLATRRTQAKVASAGTMLLAVVTFVLARESVTSARPDLLIPAFILLVFTLGAAAGTVWLARGRFEWRIGSGRVTLRRRYGSGLKDVFEGRRLLLDTNTDSDGDPWFELFALAGAEKLRRPGLIRWQSGQPKDRRSIARVMNDATSVRDLAAWLSRETGLELDDFTTPQAQEAQLVELRALLENSGPFGKWAAGWVDKLEKRKKAN